MVADSGVRLFGRSGKDHTDRFPETVAAVAERFPPALVPAGQRLVLDGEIVSLHPDGRLDFGAVMRRFNKRPDAIRALARTEPVTYVVFDVLESGGENLRPQPYRVRRAALEELLPRPSKRLQRTRATRDRDEAVRWFTELAPLIEGIVTKGADTRYRPGGYGWLKTRQSATVELVAAAVLGTLARPERLALGVWDASGALVVAGMTSRLGDDAVAQVTESISPATAGHPWKRAGLSPWAPIQGHRKSMMLIDPVAAEILADSHPPTRRTLLRLRPDLDPATVARPGTPKVVAPALPVGTTQALPAARSSAVAPPRKRARRPV